MLRGPRVLVRLAPVARMTAGGILLGEAMPPPVCYGKVVQLGPRCVDVAAGDVVAFPPTAGEDVAGFVTPHLILNEGDVLFAVERTT